MTRYSVAIVFVVLFACASVAENSDQEKEPAPTSLNSKLMLTSTKEPASILQDLGLTLTSTNDMSASAVRKLPASANLLYWGDAFVITNIKAGSKAVQTNLEQGDVITTFNNKRFKSIKEVNAFLQQTKPSKLALSTYDADGTYETVNIILDEEKEVAKEKEKKEKNEKITAREKEKNGKRKATMDKNTNEEQESKEFSEFVKSFGYLYHNKSLAKISFDLYDRTSVDINSQCKEFIKEHDNEKLVRNIQNLQLICGSMMQLILGEWNRSIENSSKYPGVRLPNFSQTIIIMKSEFTKNHVYTHLEECFSLVKNDLKKLDKKDKEKTFDLYSILSQYKDAITKIEGSYNSYSDNYNSYRDNFSKTSSLAELEW